MNWKLLRKSAERTNDFHQQDKLEMKLMKNTKICQRRSAEQ